MEEKKLLFENLKNIKDYWAEHTVQRLNNDELIWSQNRDEYKLLKESLKDQENKDAFQKVVNGAIEGAIHSILVMIDGGDALADSYLVDLIIEEDKRSFKEEGALHEDFFEFLLDQGDL